MSPEEKLKAVTEKLLAYKNDIRDVIISRIKETSDWQQIQKYSKNQLPKHINDYDEDSPQHFWISCKLTGEDPLTKDLSKCIPILWDQEFECEDYRSIGFNDGMAIVVTNLFGVLGMEKEASETFEATYDN